MSEGLQDESLRIIARCLAFHCLNTADVRDKNLAVQAKFLEGLGLPLKESAGLLGTTEASLRELLRVANKKRKKPNGTKTKKGG